MHGQDQGYAYLRSFAACTDCYLIRGPANRQLRIPAAYCLSRSGSPIAWTQGDPLQGQAEWVMVVSARENAGDCRSGRKLVAAVTVLPLLPDCNGLERAKRYSDQKNTWPKSELHYWSLRVKRIGDLQDDTCLWMDGFFQLIANPFTEEEESRIIDHMNSDHVDAMRHYLRVTDSSAIPIMLGIDTYGFHLYYEGRVHWIAFESPVHDMRAAWEQLVTMAHR